LEFVSDESVTRAISLLRRAFRDAGSDLDYIETVPRRGYRVTADEAPAGVAALTNVPAQAAQKPLASPNSIAVLAFVDMSPAGDQGHFADGIAEEIINALMRVPHLRVIGRTSSFAFKSRNETIPTIAAALDVSLVLQGSVRKHGQRLRISAQLVAAESERHLWSQTFDGGDDDIFYLQERIAIATATSLKSLFDGGAAIALPLAENLTSSREVYDLFLRARSLAARTHAEGALQHAAACLERAFSLDSVLGECWVALANTYVDMASHCARETGLVAGAPGALAVIELRPNGGPRTLQPSFQVSSANSREHSRIAADGRRSTTRTGIRSGAKATASWRSASQRTRRPS
jgi:TolB-like protein